MEAHLDTAFDEYPAMFPCLGTVRRVVAKDATDNPTQSVTLYQVEIHQQWPTQSFLFPFAPYMGQCAGELVEKEEPLCVGQVVVVGFLEGNPNRPFIMGPYFSHDTTIAQTTAQHPRVTRRYNETTLEADKDGNVTIQLTAQKGLTVKDDGGAVLFKLAWTGAAYEVQLGGDSGLERVCKESLIQALSLLFGAATVTPGDGGATLKGNIATALNASFTNANTTTVTKAK